MSGMPTKAQLSQWPALVANALLFQCAWFANVTASAIWAILVTVFVLAAHLLLVRALFGSQNWRREVLWLSVVVVVGWMVETGAFMAQLLVYDAPPSWQLGWVPGWLLCLWLAFATTFRFSMSFLTQNPFYAVPIGFLALFSYLGGAALNSSVSLGGSVVMSAVFIGLIWAAVLPLLSILYRRFWLKPCTTKSWWSWEAIS